MSGARDDHVERLAKAFEITNDTDPARAFCRACVEILAVAGTSLVAIAESLPSVLASSNIIAGQLEDLQLTLGEGPTVDAHRTGRAVSEPNIAHPRRERWLAFGPAALDTGARAMFSFPLRVGGVRFGAFTVHQTTVGDLSDTQYADALAAADIATTAILGMQAKTSRGNLSPQLEMLAEHNAAVHQASGMVSVQLGIGVGEALVRLRGYAFAANQALADVGADVVARRLRLAD